MSNTTERSEAARIEVVGRFRGIVMREGEPRGLVSIHPASFVGRALDQRSNTRWLSSTTERSEAARIEVVGRFRGIVVHEGEPRGLVY